MHLQTQEYYHYYFHHHRRFQYLQQVESQRIHRVLLMLLCRQYQTRQHQD
jgi:hypothetical protein